MQNKFVFGFMGLLLGLVLGFFASNALNRESALPAADAPATATAATVAAPDSQTSQGGMQPDVAEMIERAAAEPQNFAVQMKTGDRHAQIGQFNKAVEYYLRGVAMKPDDFQANVVLANAYFDSRQFENAADYYTRALLANPKDANARTDLGTTFVERSNPDYDRAIKEFKTALEIKPGHEPSLYYLGIASFRKGDVKEAETALADLEKANPSSDLIGRLRQNIAGQ